MSKHNSQCSASKRGFACPVILKSSHFSPLFGQRGGQLIDILVQQQTDCKLSRFWTQVQWSFQAGCPMMMRLSLFFAYTFFLGQKAKFGRKKLEILTCLDPRKFECGTDQIIFINQESRPPIFSLLLYPSGESKFAYKLLSLDQSWEGRFSPFQLTLQFLQDFLFERRRGTGNQSRMKWN